MYGEPAVAVAIDARVHISVDPCEGVWKMDGYPLESGRHPHVVYLRNAVLGEDFQSHAIQVRSDLFPAAGLGSSAALSAAGCAALLSISNEPLDEEKIATFAHHAEAQAQAGRASPIDTSTATLGGCVLVSDKREELANWQYTRTLETPEGRSVWEIHSVDLPPTASEMWLVVGYTGIHAPTAELVKGVADLLTRNSAKMEDITRMGEVARDGVTALSAGDFIQVGKLMDEAHLLLAGLGVSCPELDDMVEVARRTSLGAKLTGAGGGDACLR